MFASQLLKSILAVLLCTALNTFLQTAEHPQHYRISNGRLLVQLKLRSIFLVHWLVLTFCRIAFKRVLSSVYGERTLFSGQFQWAEFFLKKFLY